MMGTVRWLLLAAVLLVSYRISQIPIPEGSSQPMRVKILCAGYMALSRSCALLETLGVTTEVVAKNFIFKSVYKLLKTPPDGVTMEDTSFEGIPVRIYTPIGHNEAMPGMVFYHGGGWTIGDLDSHHAATEMFAREGNMVVVSVQYRLNPEFSVRDGFLDCVRATQHFIEHAETYHVDSQRVCVAGDSAGGNYAAAVSLYLRDQNFTPMPKLQLLIYPSVQLIDLQLPSFQQNANGPLLDRRELMWFLSIIYNKSSNYMEYFDTNAHVPRDVRRELATTVLNTDLLPPEMLYPPYKPPRLVDENEAVWNKVKDYCYDPYHYPLMAEDHGGLPEAYVFTAQYDPLRDDGFLYAGKLREAGVKVTHYNCPFCWHGMINFVRELDDTRRVIRGMVSFLKERI